MSFPKAKLLRFNECGTDTPAPGTYDPKLPESKIGAVMDRSKRFTEKKELFGSTESLDSAVCCRHSHNLLPPPPTVFRTPQMPRKKVPATPRSAIETSRKFSSTSRTKKNLSDVFGQDKKSEDNSINRELDVLEKAHACHVIVRDQEVAALQNEISELKRTILKIENSNDVVLTDLKGELKNLNLELEKSNNELEREKDKHQKNVVEFKGQIEILEENVKNCNSINFQLENELFEKQKTITEMAEKYEQVKEELKKVKKLIEEMVKDHAAEVLEVKQRCRDELEALATAAELNVDLVSRKMEDRLKIIEMEVESNKKEGQLVLKSRLDEALDMVREKAKLFDSQVLDVLSKLADMKEHFTQRSDSLVDSLKICQEWNEEKLQESLKTLDELEATKAAKIEQKIMILDLQAKVEELEEEVTMCKKQRTKYEVIQYEANKTIQVLSQRLFESESEVEKQNEMREEMKLRSNALEEKIRNLIHENNKLTTSMSEIRTAIVKEVKEVENVLIGKVEIYRKKAAEETRKFRITLEEKQNQIELMLQELEYYRVKAIETAEYVSLCQNRIACCKDETREANLRYKELEIQHNKKMTEQRNLYASLIEKHEQLKKELMSENKKVKAELDEVLMEKQKLDQLFCKESEECDKLHSALEETRKDLSNAKSDVERLTETCNDQERHIEELAIQLEHYTECAQKTTQQMNSLAQSKEELEVELKKCDELLNEKDLKIEALSVELSESKNYVQNMSDHFVSLMNELATEKDALLQELEIKNVNMIQVSEEYERIKILYNAEINKVAELEKAMKDMQSEHEKYDDTVISELILEKERCVELSNCVDEINVKKRELEKRIVELEEKLVEGDKVQNRLKVLECSLTEAKAENVDLSNEVHALYREIEELEKQIEEEKKEKDGSRGRCAELEAEKGDLMEMTRQQQEELELLQNELSRQQETIDELKQLKLDSAEEMRSQIEAEVSDQMIALQLDLEEKQKLLSQLQAREQDLLYKLKAAEVDLNAGETQQKEMESKLKEATDRLHEALDMCTALEKRKFEYKLLAGELQREIDSLKNTITDLNEEKEKLKEQSHEESMKMTGLSATIADLECRNRELESCIGPFKELLTQFEAERSELMAKMSTTERELRALEMDHAKSLGHQNHKQKIRYVVQLTEQLNELKNEVEKTRAENVRLRAELLKEGGGRPRRRENKENPGTTPGKLRPPAPAAGSGLTTLPGAARQASPAALKERNTSAV